MKRLGTILLAIGVAAAVLWQSAAAVQQPQSRGGRGAGRGVPVRQRKAVLAWADTRNGIAQHDSVSHALAVIERLGYESGLYDTYIRTDSNIIAKQPLMTDGKPASGGPSLANVDAIFFLGHREIQLDAQQKADLLSFVRDEGKGFVAGHTASTAFESWPEFGEMLGARYDGHPWNTVAGTVINEDPAFPATKHFPSAFSPHGRVLSGTVGTPAPISACSCGSTCRRCPRIPRCIGRTATSRSRGPRCTGKAECSMRHSVTPPRPGTIRTSAACTSKH